MTYELSYLQAVEPEALPRDRDVDVFVHEELDGQGFNEVSLSAETPEQIVAYVREFWGDDDEKWFAEYVVARIERVGTPAELAKALRDAEATGDQDTATEVLNVICARLNLPLDQTEQGLTREASLQVDAFVAANLPADYAAQGPPESYKMTHQELLAKRAQMPPYDVWRFDRDSGGGLRCAPEASAGIPPTTEQEETKMATATPAKKKTAPATRSSAGAEARSKKATTESVPAIQETLLGLLERELGVPVEKKPNASKTYTRLQVDGKTFAYVFPPRSNGLALKIPKQLLGVFADLPKGHGFKKTGWGLTRTVTKAAEAPTVAKALAAAAAAATRKPEDGQQADAA